MTNGLFETEHTPVQSDFGKSRHDYITPQEYRVLYKVH